MRTPRLLVTKEFRSINFFHPQHLKNRTIELVFQQSCTNITSVAPIPEPKSSLREQIQEQDKSPLCVTLAQGSDVVGKVYFMSSFAMSRGLVIAARGSNPTVWMALPG